MCVLTALAYLFLQHLHAACIFQRDAAKLAWVFLTVEGTHGHPLRLARCRESFAVDHSICHAFYTLLRRSSADPPTHSATIRWGLPRTGRRRFLSMQRVRQEVLASAGGFWLDRMARSLFHRLPLLWLSCHHFRSNLGTSTRHWCPGVWDVRHLSSDLVPVCFPFAFRPCQWRARKFSSRWSPWHTMLWTSAPRLAKFAFLLGSQQRSRCRW